MLVPGYVAIVGPCIMAHNCLHCDDTRMRRILIEIVMRIKAPSERSSFVGTTVPLRSCEGILNTLNFARLEVFLDLTTTESESTRLSCIAVVGSCVHGEVFGN